MHSGNRYLVVKSTKMRKSRALTVCYLFLKDFTRTELKLLTGSINVGLIGSSLQNFYKGIVGVGPEMTYERKYLVSK